MSHKSSPKRKRKTNAPRPNSKTFWIQRIMGIFLLVLILGVLIILAVNFFKEAQQERRLVSRPHQANVAGQQHNSQSLVVHSSVEPKYTFSEELQKRNAEVQQELQQKIAKAEKTEIQGRHYRIQIGAFNERKYADQLRAKMILRDYPVQIINDGNLYLVQIGPYGDRDIAIKTQERLQREGIKDLVLKAYVR